MRSFREDIERAVAFHGHLCSGQCLGVRMAHLGLRKLGLDNETDRKKIVVFTECNRCPADSIMISTGCSVGKRTFYFADLGKLAATFINTETNKAVRVAVEHRLYPEEGEDMLDFYENLPDEGWLKTKEVTVTLKPGDKPGPPVCAVICDECGEEVTDERHVECSGRILCKACAGVIRYYD